MSEYCDTLAIATAAVEECWMRNRWICDLPPEGDAEIVAKHIELALSIERTRMKDLEVSQ